ncbi:probable 4-coumarate--CoA ligase 2 isoform X2 [Dermacentor albipictus]|uniref:probable 4-coumarate--CoA ligase 2 isoform X2 n=1 Tax=Dermacentor albipictus TaxID=60249 RepID=UPI0038FD0364
MRATIKNGIVYSPYPKVDIPLCSVYTAMKEFLTASPERLALVDEQMRLTCGEFFSRLRRFAAGFQAQGVGLGDRVCVHLENSVENVVVLFSITFTGASVLLSNPMLNESELLFQVDYGDATHILTSPQHAAKVTAVERKTKVKGLFVIGEPVPGFVSVSEFTELNEDDFKEVPIGDPKQTTVAVYFSSGTTGDAKGVEVSHHNLVANLHMTKTMVNYEPGDVLLTWYPINTAGFMFTPVAASTGATCVVVHHGLTFHQFVYYVRKYDVTTLATVPARLHYYMTHMMRTETKLPSIKKINLGGTVLTQTFANKILEVFNGVRSLRSHYGMSESCGVLCSPPNGELHSGNVGFPAPMVELKFIDMDTGEKVGPRQYGELYFRIPSVMKEYYKNSALMKQFMDDDGWCKSGKTEKFKHLYGGVVFMDLLPRNANGKVIKRDLKLLYEKSKVY